MFGQTSQPLILNNFEDSDLLFIIIRIACFIVLVATYPIVGLTLLTNWSTLIYKTEEHLELPWTKRGVLYILENGLPLLLGIFLPNVRPALSIGGAFGGGITNFFLPPLMYIFVYQKTKKDVMFWVMAFFSGLGLVFAGISTYESVIDAINAFKSQSI
ncbi:hypothetical protein TVAG_124970 [Trichomonas vaginalis G3]|uniref:Amino acid transporter transmembrane domain-containing protein n=1 Tax=Trichomonas vaginalis (strain ATCC PRA-98 / G3) TaxID=412133 RepID=A2EIK3_TRIV3|nr:amino acid transmembrane transporter protein [Trichomonas vaginalis G3]EAY07524.1 hypothetical protein TVAG_124970 [Trichomonas vaginalis G3]KAI5550522.1 amino acid transmembrane transporter protein [Trichomonas vaginalis G3]|eukprot:XP_001319747.1 hypothetical protein [Trichomonas vaginalis G3]